MKKQLVHFALPALLIGPLAVLGAGYAGRAFSAPPPPKSAPIRLRLSAEKEIITADAQGKPRASWAALSAAAGDVHPGDVLRYRVQAENTGAAPITGLVVTQPVPAKTVYVARSAEGSAAENAPVTYSLDGRQFSEQPVQIVTGPDGVARPRPAAPESYTALRWRFAALAAKTAQSVTYQVRVR